PPPRSPGFGDGQGVRRDKIDLWLAHLFIACSRPVGSCSRVLFNGACSTGLFKSLQTPGGRRAVSDNIGAGVNALFMACSALFIGLFIGPVPARTRYPGAGGPPRPG